jgi:flagellar basal-body rod protein FlgB
MTAGLDTGLGFYRDVLALRGYRQEVLTSNIANANTPGFKAKDLDFKAALDAVSATPSSTGAAQANAHFLQVSNPRHIGSAEAAPGLAAAFVKYKADNQVTLDGNSVDLDKEKVAAAANAVDYTSVTTFTTQTLRMMQTAIGGAGSSQSGGG